MSKNVTTSMKYNTQEHTEKVSSQGGVEAENKTPTNNKQ